MELQELPSPLLFFFSFIIIVTLVSTLKRAYKPRPRTKLPPGPWKLPVIGSMHHLMGSLPHHELRDLARKHGPLMHLKLGQVDLIVVSSREAAREAMKAHDLNFASRPVFTTTKIMSYGCASVTFAPYGSLWRQLRMICTLELLSTKRVKSFGWLREEETAKLMKSFSMAPKVINLTKELIRMINSFSSRAAFGEKCPLQEGLVSALKESMEISTGFNIADTFPSLEFINVVSGARSKIERVHRKLDGFLGDIVREHQANKSVATAEKSSQGDKPKGGDLVDAMLWYKEHGNLGVPLTIDSIKITILEMFTGGTETSSTLAIWAMSELMKNPKVMIKAQNEVREALKGKTKVQDSDLGGLTYLKLVIKESLRLHPPLPLLVPRESKETCRILGYDVPAGSRLIINAWALGRDPRYWEDAEKFKPERFDGSTIDFRGADFEFLPFGSGRRTCPGMAFGIATVELILANLLFYFNWELPGGMKAEELDMTENFAISAIRKTDLCLLSTPRFPVQVL